jgi:hypothetical protein
VTQPSPNPVPGPYYNPAAPPLSPPPPAPRRRSNAVIGGIIGAVVVLIGLGIGGYLFLGPKELGAEEPKGLDAEEVEAQIIQNFPAIIGLVPTAVDCPDNIPIATGRTDTCTGTLEGDRVTFTVRQTDDDGHRYDVHSHEFYVVSAIERFLAERISAAYSVEVVAECAGGDRVVVGPPGTTIPCTVTSVADPSAYVSYTATMLDAEGNSVEVVDADGVKLQFI